MDVGLNGGWMTICALAIMLQTSFIVIMVALSASYVHEEVKNEKKGVAIISNKNQTVKKHARRRHYFYSYLEQCCNLLMILSRLADYFFLGHEWF